MGWWGAALRRCDAHPPLCPLDNSLCLCAPSLPFSSGQPALLGCCLPCFGFCVCGWRAASRAWRVGGNRAGFAAVAADDSETEMLGAGCPFRLTGSNGRDAVSCGFSVCVSIGQIKNTSVRLSTRIRIECLCNVHVGTSGYLNVCRVPKESQG